MKKYFISHEDIDTLIYVVEDSDITKGYLTSIYTALLKRQSKHVRIPIEFKAVQGTKTYPEIKILQKGHPDIPNLASQYSKGELVANITIEALDGNFNRIPFTGDALRHAKRDLVIQYTRKQFDPDCEVEDSEITSKNHFGIIFHFLPKNITAIRKGAKKLGLEITSQKELREKLENTEAKFKEDPPRIEWGGFAIDIPHDTIQHSACRVAFNRKPNKLISWDEVADQHDGDGAQGIGTTQRSVYDAFLRINDRIKNVTKKCLFKTGKMASFRLY